MDLQMSDFETRYKVLNDAQQQAVKATDGPVMVVAGPGTGKTELLSMRVANILRTTDTLPQNILCLTYTESGAHAMRERLAGLIGIDAYKVSINTFHSFGTEIINKHGDYFYHGAHFRPADELSSYEILRTLFEKLPHNNPLSSKMNDEYTYLRDTQSTISDLKKSGLISDELSAILDRNDAFTEWFQPQLETAFRDRLSKKSFDAIATLISVTESYVGEPLELITYEPLHEMVLATLTIALEDAVETNTTKPISAWKRSWCEKRDDGQLTLKDVKRSSRLRAVSSVYYSYLLAMQERSLYDFDDMILRVVHALEIFNDLRLNLQEQYQYIMVDEFQDTNDAQMRLLWNLTNNPSSEGRPNIMIVGDDDQAIYRFQGATLSNIIDFRTLYHDTKVITLKDNYRSTSNVLELARQTIVQATERLEHVIPELDKTLTPHYKPRAHMIDFRSYQDEASEYAALAEHVALNTSENPTFRFAIIARHHRQLQTMLPYLQKAGLTLSYDRRDNVLDSPPIKLLELLSRVVTLLAQQRLEDVNGLLPELLAHPAWNIADKDLWKLSIDAYRSQQFWLETMLSYEGQLADIAEWLILSAHISLYEPLEYTLDHLTGTIEEQVGESGHDESNEENETALHEGFHSPLRDYFFSHELLSKKPATYIAYLDALSAIRTRLRDYRPEGQLLLRDFIYCVDKYHELKLTIQATGRVIADNNPVELLTAHRSKGLEFDTVYIVGLTDSIWGEASRSRGKLISYPHNLPIGIGGDTSDEHIRLLFVALTRAKSQLHLSSHSTLPSGKSVLPVAYLSHMEPVHDTTTSSTIETQKTAWQSRLTTTIDHTMSELLRDTLASYKLSATHLGNYLDVSRGGPELFLLQNLLRFPQAMSPSAAFGSAIHGTLQRAHAHYTATHKKRPIEDLLGDFETLLQEYQLANDQYDYYAKRGSDVLTTFFTERYNSFSASQRVEQRFGSVVLPGDVRLSGAIDLMDINDENKTIVVTDYKTGKSTNSWQGGTEYEKMKLHHYRQQLLFYKILIEQSPQFIGYTVTKGIIEFVEPDKNGAINRIELEYDLAELAEFEKLVKAVWQRIQSLAFTLEKTYDANLKGIVDFETDIT